MRKDTAAPEAVVRVPGGAVSIRGACDGGGGGGKEDTAGVGRRDEGWGEDTVAGVQLLPNGEGARRDDGVRRGEEAAGAAARGRLAVDQGEGHQDHQDAWDDVEAVPLFSRGYLRLMHETC